MSVEPRDAVLRALALYAEQPLPDHPDRLRAVGDLGFDSHDGIAVACELSALLGFDIPNEINPLVDDEEKRGRTVQEIVDLISKLVAERRKG